LMSALVSLRGRPERGASDIEVSPALKRYNHVLATRSSTSVFLCNSAGYVFRLAAHAANTSWRGVRGSAIVTDGGARADSARHCTACKRRARSRARVIRHQFRRCRRCWHERARWCKSATALRHFQKSMLVAGGGGAWHAPRFCRRCKTPCYKLETSEVAAKTELGV
jgi:hypothetical protein